MYNIGSLIVTKCTTLRQDVNNRQNWAEGAIYGTLLNFSVSLKTTLKSKLSIFKKIYLKPEEKQNYFGYY